LRFFQFTSSKSLRRRHQRHYLDGFDRAGEGNLLRLAQRVILFWGRK